MPRYKVTLREVAFYDVVVEAEDAAVAEVAAEAAFVQAESVGAFGCEVTERDAIACVAVG